MTIGTGTQCQKHGLLYVEECYECLREERDTLAAQVDDLKTAGRQARDDATAALDLVSRIRMALNDNGKRMQDELLIYCRELATLPARVAELEEKLAACRATFDHPVKCPTCEHHFLPYVEPKPTEPLPDCDCPTCGRGHLRQEVPNYPGLQCDHCGARIPF